MMKRFWIISLAWIIAVAASAPLLIEAADRRGIGLALPGIPVTLSEVLVGAIIAFTPPLAILMWIRRRSLNGRGDR
jgi:hypothetical protein